jgi:hypothetical protein
VLAVGFRWLLVLPKHTACRCVHAEQCTKGCGRVTTGDEDPFVPDHRRGVAGAGQADFPVVVLLRPPDGHGLGIADAAAIRTAKAIPRRLIGGCGQAGQETYSDDGQNAADHDSYTPKP